MQSQKALYKMLSAAKSNSNTGIYYEQDLELQLRMLLSRQSNKNDRL